MFGIIQPIQASYVQHKPTSVGSLNRSSSVSKAYRKKNVNSIRSASPPQ